jgi:ADP-ribose pyrophosphatase YjhB (NUDIX family)
MTLRKGNPTVSLDIMVEDPVGRLLLGELAPTWTDNGRYLWGFPGREVESGEDLCTAARRCLEEELGLSLVSAKAVSVNTNLGFGNHFVSIGILARATGSISNNHPGDWLAWRWFDRSSLPDRLFPSAKQTLLAFSAGVVSVDFLAWEAD